ncbi:MAG: Fe-S cluster assembly protein SufD [Dehalococcoidia bacterium]|nr:Fe-S cluster assembly protein SufD [Dehalococcoidia bacterium]
MAETTTQTAAVPAPYAEDAVTAAAERRGEPAWLVERRREAARAFAATPMPTPALRPWKYTDVTALDIGGFAPVGQSPTTVQGTPPAGGFAGSLADALADAAHAEQVRQHLGTLVPATEGKFTAANQALWTGGAYVYVPRGQAFEQPVVVTLDVPAGDAGAVFPRLLLVAEAQGEVNVVLRNTSGDAPLLAPGVFEIFAGPDAKVRVLVDGRWGDATQEFTTIRSRLDRSADVLVASLALGGRVVKQTTEALLEGDGANSTIRGVALGDGEQHFDFVTLQDHSGEHTTSDVAIKSALAGASKSIYYGITRVGETAAGAEANQENRNLLLSGRAKADSDPVLEILTSQVIRCGHAATVGPVDQEALFYLQSRGLSSRQALQLMVAGFFRTVLAGIPLEGLEEDVSAVVVEKLATAEL